MSAVPTDDSARPGVPVLAARSITVDFGGITALEDVSAESAAGEMLGVIGPNGAGKTTLFNVICGFVKPDSGTISSRAGRSRDPPRPAGRAWGSRARSRASACSRS